MVSHETLGTSFPGVLVSDCLASYDDARAIQHKCYAHHLKASSRATDAHEKGGEGFLRQVKALLKAAQAFKKLMAELNKKRRLRMRRALEDRATRLLAKPRGAGGGIGGKSAAEAVRRPRRAADSAVAAHGYVG